MDPEGPATRSWRHIVVAVNSSAESAQALREAVAAARSAHARLTLICVAPRPWPCVAFAGISPAALQCDLTREAADVARRLAATIPRDLPCTTYARSGASVREILKVLRTERADALFIAAPHGALGGPCGRWALRRLLRRASVDVVSVGDDPRPIQDAQAWSTTPIPA